MRYSWEERKLPAKSKNVVVLQIKVKTTWLASNSLKPFPVRKKVRRLQFWTETGKTFIWVRNSYNWRDKAGNRRRPFSLEKKTWQQPNLATKPQKHSLQWYKVTIIVITCKNTKTSMQCKKAENSVIWQRNSKNVLFSEIELTSVNWPKKMPGKQFFFKESKNWITTTTKHKNGFGCHRAQKSLN